ncbi:MAG: hypothetical protein U5N58_13535 [Actinomycetota bacterium]|nr:hypothetical protein [Actinomycetota bacterium]
MKNRNRRSAASVATIILVSVLCWGCSYPGTGEITGVQQIEGPARDNQMGEQLMELLNRVVSPPVITSHRAEEVIYSGTERQVIFIEGYADAGNRIDVYVNGVLKADSIRAGQDGFFKSKEGLEIVEGRNSIEVIAISGSGQKSSPTRFSLMLKVPDKIEYALYQDNQSLKQIEDIYFLKQGDPSTYIKGYYLPGSEIFLQVNDKIVGQTTTDSEGSFSFTEVALVKGENDISIWGTTQDGITSQPVSTHILVIEDSSSPYPSNLSGYNDGFGNHLSWSAAYDDNFHTYKLVRVEDPCLNPEYPDHDVIATFGDIGVSSYTDQDIEKGNSYYYTLWTLDRAGNAISSNVLALPPPVYSISIELVAPFEDNIIGRREWYYKYYKITNNGNVTVDLQPIMLWIKLDPEPEPDKNMWPLWEAHIWDPDSGQYYYSNESIEQTYIADYWALDGVTEIGEVYEYSLGDEDGEEVIEVRDVTTKKTQQGEGKRVMTTTTYTENVETGEKIEGSEESTQTLVEPEKIGTVIENLAPGKSVKLAVKVQNISAGNGDRIIVHFHFAPVDCDGYFYTDEEVSTRDIFVFSSGRN